MAATQESVNLKPNKPEVIDYLIVDKWLYKVEQHLAFFQLSSPSAVLTEANNILYVSMFLTGPAAVWWQTTVQANTVLSTWAEIDAKMAAEFVPAELMRRATDQVRKLLQKASVSEYPSDSRNMRLAVPGMTDGEMWDRFSAGLQHEIRLEGMKYRVATFQESTRDALRVHIALWDLGVHGSRA